MVLAPEVESLSQIQLNAPRETIPQDLTIHARAIWKCLTRFSDIITYLPADELDIGTPEYLPTERTSPANIGLNLLTIIAAEELGFLSHDKAIEQASQLALTLTHLEYRNGLPLAWYDTKTAKPIKKWSEKDGEYRHFHSLADYAWFAAGIYGASQAYPDIPELKSLLETIDLGKFYNTQSQLCSGELSLDGEHSAWESKAITEMLIASLLGVALGQIPSEHLNILWENAQKLQQELRPDWQELFPGVVPTWGGSMFEALMAFTIFNGERLGAHLWPHSHQEYVAAQQRRADPGTGAWGYSPASTGSDYCECGVPELGLKGYPCEDKNGSTIVATYADYLVFLVNPPIALEALQKLANVSPDSWSDEYGLPDAFNVTKKTASSKVLFLDKSMELLSLAQHLKPECVRKYFRPLEDTLIPHLTSWKFN